MQRAFPRMASRLFPSRLALLCVSVLAVVGVTPNVLAQEVRAPGPLVWGVQSRPYFSDVELSVGLGMMDRGTTGIGAPLLGAGYDHAGGAVLEFDVRLFKQAWHRIVHHGIALRAFHQNGRTLGVTQDGTFQISGLDLAYVLRALLPCMSDDQVRFHLTPLVGLSVLQARAGNLHVRGDQTGELDDAARAAFDHVALGGVLGVQFDVHYDALLLALTADIREHFAVGDTPVARDFMTSLTLRVGVDINL